VNYCDIEKTYEVETHRMQKELPPMQRLGSRTNCENDRSTTMPNASPLRPGDVSKQGIGVPKAKGGRHPWRNVFSLLYMMSRVPSVALVVCCK